MAKAKNTGKAKNEQEEAITPHQPSDVIQPQNATPATDEVLTEMQKVPTNTEDEAVPAFKPANAVVSGGTVDSAVAAPLSPSTASKAPPTPSASAAWWRSKKVLMTVAAIVVVLAGAGYYFGYKTNPSVIYSQSLSNTGKGYDKLITYVDQQSKLKSKGAVGSGSYKYTSPDFTSDGTLTYKSDDQNGEFTVDVGLAGQRVNADFRAIKSAATTPDFYIKVNGIKGLGTMLGTPELDAKLASLDNSWVVIDHTLIDSLAGMSSKAASQPTREQILDEARAFGKVNQQYVFTTQKDKAVTKVVKKHGLETVDGHKTYHYTVALQKENVKKYITAQRDALKSSKLGDWIKKNNYDSYVYPGFNSLKQSANGIKSSDTFDIWMDVNQHIVYKVRLSDTKNPADNYADIGLDYKGGDNYPFFISTSSKEDGKLDIGSLKATLNTKTGAVNFKMNIKGDGSGVGTLISDFTFKPSNGAVHIDKPANAKPLSQAISELGYGDMFNGYLQELNATSSTDLPVIYQ